MINLLSIFIEPLFFILLWKLFFLWISPSQDALYHTLCYGMAISTGALGLMHLLFEGVFRLPFFISICKNAGLPVKRAHLLLHLLCTTSHDKGWCYLLSSCCILLYINPSFIPFASLYIIYSALLWTACLTLFYSLQFWQTWNTNDMEELIFFFAPYLGLLPLPEPYLLLCLLFAIGSTAYILFNKGCHSFLARK